MSNWQSFGVYRLSVTRPASTLPVLRGLSDPFLRLRRPFLRIISSCRRWTTIVRPSRLCGSSSTRSVCSWSAAAPTSRSSSDRRHWSVQRTVSTRRLIQPAWHRAPFGFVKTENTWVWFSWLEIHNHSNNRHPLFGCQWLYKILQNNINTIYIKPLAGIKII